MMWGILFFDSCSFLQYCTLNVLTLPAGSSCILQQTHQTFPHTPHFAVTIEVHSQKEMHLYHDGSLSVQAAPFSTLTVVSRRF